MRFPLSTASALGLALALALAATDAGAEMVTLNPSKDNTLVQIQQGSTELSNGQGDIFVGRTNQNGQGPSTISIRRGLVRFDVAGAVPAGAVVTSASLTMWDVRGLNGSQTIGLHRALADWGEGASFFNGGVGGPAEAGDATWFSRFYDAANPSQGPAWTNPGGDFDPTVSGSAVVTEHPSDVEAAFTWTGAGMVADVQGWLDDPSGNFGWLLLGNEAMGQTAKRFRSGEAAPAFVPTLTILFRLVPEPGALALTLIGGLGAAAAARRPRRGS